MRSTNPSPVFFWIASGLFALLVMLGATGRVVMVREANEP